VEAAVMARDHILHRVRTALGRSAGQAPPDPPPARIRIPESYMDARIASLIARVEALAGQAMETSDPRSAVATAIEGKTAVASNAPYLAQCGIATLPGVRSGITDRDELRALCATADIGITSADYALADTGTLVLLSSPREARLISLLPPAHIAVVPRDRILTGLDELFSILPNPAEESSSMVLITGPSRTADIEQILIRGVHGPGQIRILVGPAAARTTWNPSLCADRVMPLMPNS
jgi:L-lactate dehydrogenase complex protein LldG